MTKREIPIFKHFAIELNSDCNRDCFFCPRHGDRSGKRKTADGRHIRKHMPAEKVLELLDQAKNVGYIGKINFHHLSEPFLDRRLIEMAMEARRRGFKCIIHTNGDVLRKNYKICRKATKVFSEITVGLYDYNSPPQRQIQQLIWKFKLRGTDLHFSKVESAYPRHGIDLSRVNMSQYEQQVTLAVDTPCLMAAEQFIVHYDGNVGICCEDYMDEFDVGNVFEKTIDEIWWSKKHIEIVKNLQKNGGRKLYPLCRTCPFPTNIVTRTIDKT